MAEKRSALHHLGGTGRRACGVIAAGGAMVLGVEPVGAPLPRVASHGVEIEAVGWEGIDGAGAGVAVVAGVFTGKLALPYVAAMLAVRAKLVAPGVELLDEAAACGVLPLGFGGETLAGPVAVRLGVVPGDVNDRVVASGVEVGARSFGGVPLCARDLAPPGCGGYGVFDQGVKT